MGALIRLFFLGWLFAIVMFLAWLGLLFPITGSSPEPPKANEPNPIIGSDCRPQHFESIGFFDNSAVLHPESHTAIIAFSARLRSLSCVADVAGNFCAPGQLAVTLDGHTATDAARSPATEERLSFEQALAVATVFMASDMTVRSIEGFGATRPAIAQPDITPSEVIRHGDRRVEVGLRCPRQY